MNTTTRDYETCSQSINANAPYSSRAPRILAFVLLTTAWSLGWSAEPLETQHAQLVNQSVPKRLVTGESAPIEIKIKNVETNAWTVQDDISVVLKPLPKNQTWETSEVKLGPDDRVAPGETKTFRFDIIAPKTPATYTFSWDLLKNGQSLLAPQHPVATPVIVEDPFVRAKFVSQLSPDRIAVGGKFKVLIQYKNIGKGSWSNDHGYYLVARSPQAKKIWGVDTVHLDGGSRILPNETATFSFSLTAPRRPGQYDFQWQMFQTEKRWFGDAAPKLSIVVGDGEAHTSSPLRAEFVSQTVPEIMLADNTYLVTVVYKNIGSTDWRSPQFHLSAQNPPKNLNWLIDRVNLDALEVIPPGNIKVFRFNVRAPSDPGSYHFQWQMTTASGVPFGDRSEDRIINVKSE